MQHGYLRVPFFGNLIQSYELALYSQLMAVLLKSGMTITQAFEIAGIESKNVPYQDAFMKIKNRMVQGVTLSDALKDFPKLFPDNYVGIITVGEKTGTMGKSFENLADFYNRDIEIRTKDLPTVIEPILLVFIGVVVGFIALSIILPIYSLSTSLR